MRTNKPKNRNGGNSGKSNKNETTTTDSTSHSAKVAFADGGENDEWNDASHLVDVLGLMVRNLSLKNGENKINEKDDLIVDSGATLHIFRDINSVSECGGRRSLSDEVKSKVKRFNSTVTTNYVGYYTQNL